jgi:hypothetical protein
MYQQGSSNGYPQAYSGLTVDQSSLLQGNHSTPGSGHTAQQEQQYSCQLQGAGLPGQWQQQPQQWQQQGQQSSCQAPGQQQHTVPNQQHAAANQQDKRFEAACETDANGLRFTWAVFPNTEPQKGKSSPQSGLPLPEMVIPLACMFTPLKTMDALPTVQGSPARCKNCQAVWSMHGRVDANAGFWVCRSCLGRNPLPTNFDPHDPTFTSETVEYIMHRDSEARPTYIFIVDTCLSYDELEALKKNLVRCVDWLPPLSLIGFISFGHGVTAWELGADDVQKCYSLRGTRAYNQQELKSMLNITESTPVMGRFLVPLDECEFALTALIEELSTDPFPVATGLRPERATGTAIDLAVTFVELLGPVKCGKLLLFTGGPCTRGPGTVVGVKKAEMMRFHRDFMDGNVPYYEAAFDFYNKIEKRLADANVSLDAFVESFDQVGVTEMRRCINSTGGSLICGDTFDHKMFTESLQRFFQRSDLKLRGENDAQVKCAFGLVIEIYSSSDTLISGCIGPCEADKQSTNNRLVSPVCVGVGGTSRWRVSSADQALTVTFVFDTETSSSPKQPQSCQQRFFQFVTYYITLSGQYRARVTSVQQLVAPTKDPQFFVFNNSFDQTCAATVVARMAMHILDEHENRWESTKRWLDRLLVTFVRRFGTYQPGVPESLRMAPCLALLPSFLFNLRRSEYFMVLNISPDETTFKRHWLMREPCESCVLMLQPTLDSYTINEPFAQPVPLDSASILQDNILLMDAFFNVHVLYGATVHEWMKAGFHENPDYAHFKAQVDAPEADANEILKKRFPYPRFSKTDVNGSEARHIKTRMNPTITHNTQQQSSGGGGEVIYTDEASISRFMQTLRTAAVTVDSA